MRFAFAGVVAFAGITASTVAWAQVAPVGPEFQVNTFTTGYQGFPKVCRAPTGEFTAVWRSDNQDGSSSGVFGQRYDSAGATQGTEFAINTFTTNAQAFPALGCAGSGDFVVIWRSMNQDGDGGGIFGQRYASGGGAQGTEFSVNTFTTGSQDSPGVTIDANGDFVVVWTSAAQDGDSGGVFGQRFDSAGTPAGTEFQINSHTTGNQTTVLGSPIASDDNLNFVVTWTSDGQDGDLTGVYAQRFNSSGTAVGTEFQASSFTTSRQESAAVARDDDGDFVIVWRSMNQDGSNYGIFGQRYSTSGAAAGTEFQINTHTTGSQSFPSVAMNNLGDFVVAWASDAQDGDNSGIFGQRFDRNATPLGTEFQVNTYTTGFQSLDSVASDSIGNFVVTWISGHDGGGFGVFGQRFTVPLCPPLPRDDCLAGPGLKSFFLMKEDNVVTSRRKLGWKWLRGEATDLSDFGDPTTSTSYALCVYDQVGSVSSTTASFEVAPNTLCGVEPCWNTVGSNGYKYKNDPATGEDGIRTILLKMGPNGKSKVIVKGTGPDLALPAPASGSEFLNQDSGVTVQLVNSIGTCWTTAFPGPPLKNVPDVFRDKEQP